MGFDEGRIILESPNGAYCPGQIVKGKLVFYQENEKTFRGIYAKLKGFCKVHWTTQESYTVNGKQETRTVSHDSYEEYANAKIYLIGGESGECHLKPGDYEFPFAFHLPHNCPSSFEGSYGHIRYQIKVVVDRSFKFDQEKKVAVRVYSLLDLNKDPYCREPIEMEFSASYCCCCMGSGATNTVINVPVSGFCPGQNIPIEVSCSNNGTVDVNDIKLSVIKKIKFIATRNPDERSEKDTIAKIIKGPVPANTSRNYTVEMEVPALDVYNLNDCRYIDVTYKFKVVVNPAGCHSDSEGTHNIIIGNVPLLGFQDNIQNPLQDQMPQHMVAVTQQPLPSHSGNQFNPPSITPYPSGNTPYPAGNAPYPGGDAPYPAGNSPYPGGNAPYPGGNTPYPVATSYPSDQKTPYRTTNAPYRTIDSKATHPVEGVHNFDNPPPYPGNTLQKSPNLNDSSPLPTGNTPYPTGNKPYPTGNKPYPTGNTPYPSGKTPYPVENSPHPIGNTPYPTESSPYPPVSPSPTMTQPFPGSGISTGTTPYPSGNLPYPTGNSPYPPAPPSTTGTQPLPDSGISTEKSPYPAGNPPYPTGNCPYPPASPYPTETHPLPGSGISSLRTGTIGFRIPGSMPLSPNLNMPSPVPVNPYASASAPPSDSPIEKKE